MISVCIATYNGEKYILEQLNSILPQLCYDDEVIISDDLSTDATLAIIESINDHRIKIYINEQNYGYSKNFENALNKVKGEVIFIADQDDVWYPNKVQRMLKALENAEMAISDATGVDENLKPLYPSHFEIHQTKQGFWVNFLKTRYIGACMAFKKELLQKALPLPSNFRLCAYDYWLAIIAEYYFSVNLVNEPLLKYRRHNNNASSGGTSSHNSLFKKIEIRIYAMRELLKRKNNVSEI
ncbi:glycosyltransferase family 2 protein [Pedobacter boryungensis]|uniref:Glycosyltransferase family 2 protein n=2 Tax=Pedobacter boryungensis TaxID=869962 RepID=A0ABX2DGU8_9SPHI|nr:glycosyltransferase family 2 protein [Pedobacter boryungensis]